MVNINNQRSSCEIYTEQTISYRSGNINCAASTQSNKNKQAKMRFVHYCMFLVIISVVKARRFTFNDYNMPIRMVDTSHGEHGLERIDHLAAIIEPHHLTTNQRVNFPRSGNLERYYQAIRAPGDERGHLVGSQFSGPPHWYNLSPQNARVNRNAGYQSINTDWFGTECEVRRFLDQGGDRQVYWIVDMTYIGNSNRPNEYRLRVVFFENGRMNGLGIDTRIHNPFLREDSTFWICRRCRSNRHVHDDLRRRQLIEKGCSRR